MTKEQTKEAIRVMQAYVDGSEIDAMERNRVVQDWSPDIHPLWDWDRYIYRIKPEPRYRPYESAMELFADIAKHGSWIKDGDTCRHVYKLTKRGDHLVIELSGLKEWGINELPRLEQLVWADDGTPFGKLEE